MSALEQGTAQRLRALFGHLDGKDLLEALIHGELRGRIAVTSSFGAESAVLLDLVAAVDPATPVIFLDTGELFDETLAYRYQIERRLGLTNIMVVRPTEAELAEAEDLWRDDVDRCCELRKVAPLKAALEGHSAWLSSVKRVDGPTRTTMPIVMWDEKFGLVKVNPLATWTDEDVAYYLQSQGLPGHPLWAEGYASIGCAPMTVKPLVPGDRRSGRLVGLDKAECGLHES